MPVAYSHIQTLMMPGRTLSAPSETKAKLEDFTVSERLSLLDNGSGLFRCHPECSTIEQRWANETKVGASSSMRASYVITCRRKGCKSRRGLLYSDCQLWSDQQGRQATKSKQLSLWFACSESPAEAGERSFP